MPVAAWSLLVLMIHNGRIRPSDYTQVGKACAVKKAIAMVRRLLRAAFALKTEPFLPYRSYSGWIPRFGVEGRASFCRSRAIAIARF